MILLNTKTNTKIETGNKSMVARLIGVDRKTIYNWNRKGHKMIIYNHFTLFYDIATYMECFPDAIKLRKVGN